MLKLGIDPEKLYRTTFISQYGLCCCNMVLVSFRLFCKNLGNLQEFFGQMVYRPPGRKLPVRLCCLIVVIIKSTLLMVYYELQSISFADRIYRPVIDQLKYYCEVYEIIHI